MDKEKLFPLSGGEEIKIILHVRAQGEKYELVHVFREPTAADKKAYWGHITRLELFEGVFALLRDSSVIRRQSNNDFFKHRVNFFRRLRRIDTFKIPFQSILLSKGFFNESVCIDVKHIDAKRRDCIRIRSVGRKAFCLNLIRP